MSPYRYPWELFDCYEPPAITTAPQSNTLRVMFILACIAVITGTLIAVNTP